MTVRPETERPGAERPFHFGAPTLFGLYHPARLPAPRTAVLLCPPLGQDQIRSHRLYRQLAHALAADGFAVLRYDCRGTGDSSGESIEVDWRQCIADTVCAADELRRLSGCLDVVAFGARLGGSLALAAAVQARFVRLIAWDAVLDGSAWVAQLDTSQERLRHDPNRFQRPRSAADAADQWLGFPVSATLRAQLSALRAEPAGVPTLLLQSASAETDGESSRLRAAGVRSAALSMPAPWDDLDRLETTILAPELIRMVCDALQEPA